MSINSAYPIKKNNIYQKKIQNEYQIISSILFELQAFQENQQKINDPIIIIINDIFKIFNNLVLFTSQLAMNINKKQNYEKLLKQNKSELFTEIDNLIENIKGEYNYYKTKNIIINENNFSIYNNNNNNNFFNTESNNFHNEILIDPKYQTINVSQKIKDSNNNENDLYNQNIIIEKIKKKLDKNIIKNKKEKSKKKLSNSPHPSLSISTSSSKIFNNNNNNKNKTINYNSNSNKNKFSKSKSQQKIIIKTNYDLKQPNTTKKENVKNKIFTKEKSKNNLINNNNTKTNFNNSLIKKSDVKKNILIKRNKNINKNNNNNNNNKNNLNNTIDNNKKKPIENNKKNNSSNNINFMNLFSFLKDKKDDKKNNQKNNNAIKNNIKQNNTKIHLYVNSGPKPSGYANYLLNKYQGVIDKYNTIRDEKENNKNNNNTNNNTNNNSFNSLNINNYYNHSKTLSMDDKRN